MKDVLRNPRIIILIIALVLSLIAIGPRFDTDGVAIRSVAPDSAATQAIPLPIQGPEAGSGPKSWEVIKSINGKPINSIAEYYGSLEDLEVNKTLIIETDESSYRVVTQPILDADNETILGVEDIGIRVSDVPGSNIRKGLDLAGGTRVLLQPEEPIGASDTQLVLDNIRQRLNVFGLSDIIVRSVTDFTGETYILVEIAGVNQDEVRDLLSRQGKFEAYVGEDQVFRGGDEDILYVCRSPTCSGIDPNTGCQGGAGNYVCNFRFSISLSPAAATTMSNAINDLTVIPGTDGGYLSENISLYLDDELVNELRIASSLQGARQTEISITGSGSGATQAAAAENALADMHQLQTVLETGRLPVQLEIIQSDAISPVLGEEFLKNAMLVGILALLAVVVVVSVRYQRWKISIPTIIAMVSEVVIMLGFASIVGWRLDLAAIAGIVIAVGTGVDDQIVIADETLNKDKGDKELTWKKRVKRAFFIIFTAYFTTVVAMIPLWYSGAGLLKGFALTTIAGVTIGVLITRPAYAVILEKLLKK